MKVKSTLRMKKREEREEGEKKTYQEADIAYCPSSVLGQHLGKKLILKCFPEEQHQQHVV